VKIAEIYKKFGIPPNLQEHMILVARICLFLSKVSKGLEIDTPLLIKAALLHDLGNVVKFDLDKYPKYLGKEQKNLFHWKEVQKKMIRKYGNDDHTVTISILKELNIEERVSNIISKKSFQNAAYIKNSDDWELKILLYSDLRAGPLGIMLLKDRLEEVMQRLDKYKEKPQLADAAYQIEGQIEKYMSVPLDKLTYNILPHTAEVLRFCN
jgi:5'-deoxynucleotidase YfbR-like HD superfamily hydrolase